MKLTKWMYGALALSVMTACSNEDAPNPGAGVEDGNLSYLSVALFAPAQGTRAGGDQNQIDDPENATFEEGYANENKVNRCVFYFFDESGNPAAVKSTDAGYVNYIEVLEPETDNGNSAETVEKIVNAQLVINTPNGDQLPSKMVAVVNGATPNEEMTLDMLKSRIEDYASPATLADGFIMTNSVYAENGEEVFETNVTVDNFKASPAQAQAAPVEIYVERAVAKVRVNLDLTAEQGQMQLADGSLVNVTVVPALVTGTTEQYTTKDGDEIFVALTGWDVTATANMTTLKKNINLNWENPMNGFYWNVPTYKRSFWAANATDATAQAETVWNKTLNQFTKSFGAAGENDNMLNFNAYVNENVPAFVNGSTEAFTKVVLAGTLVTKEGGVYKPLNLIKYLGAYYTSEVEVLTQIATYLNNKVTVYKKTSDAPLTYEKVGAEDLTLVSDVVANEDITDPANPKYNKKENGKRFVTRPVLKTGTYYVRNADGTFSQINFASATDQNATEVTKFLAGSQTNYWDNGSTYYYFTIEHLGTDATKEGFYGVVRNHIYDCKVTSIFGLGTPVKDPGSQVIYPEKPNRDEWYLSAKINILSWRVVSKDYELAW